MYRTIEIQPTRRYVAITARKPLALTHNLRPRQDSVDTNLEVSEKVSSALRLDQSARDINQNTHNRKS